MSIQLTLTQEDLKDLNNLIVELPYKYANPLFNFINAKIIAQEEERKAAEQKEMKKQQEPERVAVPLRKSEAVSRQEEY